MSTCLSCYDITILLPTMLLLITKQALNFRTCFLASVEIHTRLSCLLKLCVTLTHEHMFNHLCLWKRLSFPRGITTSVWTRPGLLTLRCHGWVWASCRYLTDSAIVFSLTLKRTSFCHHKVAVRMTESGKRLLYKVMVIRELKGMNIVHWTPTLHRCPYSSNSIGVIIEQMRNRKYLMLGVSFP